MKKNMISNACVIPKNLSSSGWANIVSAIHFIMMMAVAATSFRSLTVVRFFIDVVIVINSITILIVAVLAGDVIAGITIVGVVVMVL